MTAEPPRPRAIVLLSGGIDSAVALYWARAQGWDVTALTFDYHARPAREVAATLVVAGRAGVRDVRRVPVPWMREVADLPPGPGVSAGLAAAPEGYVPARNLAFYAIAAHHAEVLGTRRIVGGHHGRDAERFPDASSAFFDAFERAANLGLLNPESRPLEVVLPLRDLGKRDVLSLGFALGVPFEETWSCYWHDRLDPCGACASCAERAGAFADLGRPDPLLAA